MKQTIFAITVLLLSTSTMFGQGANNIKINEVMTYNTENYLDEYGEKLPWVELTNNSFTTYNIRGMYLTTDRSVLDPEMSVPERMKLMSPIPAFDASVMAGRDHLLLFLNSVPEKGPRHMNVKVDSLQSVWLALYDGNAKNLIDSVTIPALAMNQSYARVKDGAEEWKVAKPEEVTPESNNQTKFEVSKVETIKNDDPHGIWLSLLSMGVVFCCLFLLYIFMKAFGNISAKMQKPTEKNENSTISKIQKASQKAITMAKDGYSTKGIEKEIYVAVIAMALSEYANDVHDLESGIITIKKKNTSWNDKGMQMLNK